MKIIKKCIIFIIVASLLLTNYVGVVKAKTIEDCKTILFDVEKEYTINKDECVLYIGESLQLEVKKNGESFHEIIWTSDDPLIAEVDSNGKITAHGQGETTIVGEVEDDYVLCYVTVKQEYMLNRTSIKMVEKDSYQLSVSYKNKKCSK